jgi:hypothetical protein
MHVDLNSEQLQKNSLELLETMRGIQTTMQSIKENNEKLLKASKEKEALNGILLKNMTNNKYNKNIGKTSNNSMKEVSIYESHNKREHSVTQENNNNVSKENTLQKKTSRNKKKEMAYVTSPKINYF